MQLLSVKIKSQPDGSVKVQPIVINTKNTDIFTRTNKVLGVGLDIDF